MASERDRVVNELEDRMPATSALKKNWPAKGSLSYVLEVREFFGPNSYRIGEVRLHGTLAGQNLSISLVEEPLT